ncbi:hypothetical protein ACYPKM_03355 [Pseudomonas aeruginosa]
MFAQRVDIRDYSDKLGFKADVTTDKGLSIPDEVNEKYNLHRMDVTLPSGDLLNLILVLTERNVSPNVIELQKDLEVIAKAAGRIAVLGCDGLRPSQRRSLLAHNINFIEPGRHYYIPQVAIALVDEARKRREATVAVSALSPSSQAVVLANLYARPESDYPGTKTRMIQRDLMCGLDYSRPAINKVSDDLVAAGILNKVDNRAFNPLYEFVGDKEEVLVKAWPMMTSPIKRTIMVTSSLMPSMDPRIAYAGASGLAEHFEETHAGLPVFCMTQATLSKLQKERGSAWVTTNQEAAKAILQVWTYASLSQDIRLPDELSLLLSFKGAESAPEYVKARGLTGHLQWFLPDEE